MTYTLEYTMRNATETTLLVFLTPLVISINLETAITKKLFDSTTD